MQQLSMSFEPGLSQRYESLRECLATQIYQKGHGRIAGQLDLAPSRLTEKLAGMRSDGTAAGVTLDELERYLDRTRDLAPIYYLLDKYCRDPGARQQEAINQLAELTKHLPALLQAAGVHLPKAARR